MVNNQEQKRYWFKAKKYGWGWQPATWEGWLIIIAFFVVAVYLAKDIDTASGSARSVLEMVANVIALTALLIIIAYKTGEKPRWRWGGKDTKREDE